MKDCLAARCVCRAILLPAVDLEAHVLAWQGCITVRGVVEMSLEEEGLYS